MPQSKWIVGVCLKEGPAGDRCVIKLLGSQFQFGAGRQQARLAGMLLGEPHHLGEGRLNLFAFHQPVDLLKITEQFMAAEFDFLPRSTGAE